MSRSASVLTLGVSPSMSYPATPNGSSKLLRCYLQLQMGAREIEFKKMKNGGAAMNDKTSYSQANCVFSIQKLKAPASFSSPWNPILMKSCLKVRLM